MESGVAVPLLRGRRIFDDDVVRLQVGERLLQLGETGLLGGRNLFERLLALFNGLSDLVEGTGRIRLNRRHILDQLLRSLRRLPNLGHILFEAEQ